MNIHRAELNVSYINTRLFPYEPVFHDEDFGVVKHNFIEVYSKAYENQFVDYLIFFEPTRISTPFNLDMYDNFLCWLVYEKINDLSLSQNILDLNDMIQDTKKGDIPCASASRKKRRKKAKQTNVIESKPNRYY